MYWINYYVFQVEYAEIFRVTAKDRFLCKALHCSLIPFYFLILPLPTREITALIEKEERKKKGL